MRALFESHNLVGDSLGISAALRAWHRDYPEYEIDMLTDDNAVAELYKGMGVPLRVIFTRDIVEPHSGVTVTYQIKYDFEHVFDVNKAFQVCHEKQCHMAQGYADCLGVDIGDKATDIGPFYDPPRLDEDDEWVNQVPERTILLAPFSRSCSSHEGKPPNKCLPWAKWKPILHFLRTLGSPIRVTGSKDERADALAISEEEYLTGMPLRPLARAMKEGRIRMLLSVDNGISHLAGSQKIPHILYYPMCLGLHYAVPWSNPYVVPIHLDPALAEPAQVAFNTRKAFEMVEQMVAAGPESPLLQREEVENE